MAKAGAEKGRLESDSSAKDGDTSINVVQAFASKKLPPPEKQSAVWTRRLVVVSFWIIVLCLGLPIWWTTTRIYRAKLPLQVMTDWADGKVGL